jgi:hypothetical protein
MTFFVVPSWDVHASTLELGAKVVVVDNTYRGGGLST